MLQGSSNRTLTSKTNPLCNRPYENRYGTIRSGGIGGHFNFEGLEDGELERQMEILSKSKDPKQYSESDVHSYSDDEKEAHAKKLSIIAHEAEKNYKRFYASRIIKPNPNEQN